MDDQTVNLSRREGPSQAEWEQRRKLISGLYVGHTLKDVMYIMSTQYGFRASIQMYKKWIRHWGLDKKFKRNEMLYIFAETRRRHSAGKSTRIMIRGREVYPDDVQRYFRRLGWLESTIDQPDTSQPLVPPSDVLIMTPPASPVIVQDPPLAVTENVSLNELCHSINPTQGQSSSHASDCIFGLPAETQSNRDVVKSPSNYNAQQQVDHGFGATGRSPPRLASVLTHNNRSLNYSEARSLQPFTTGLLQCSCASAILVSQRLLGLDFSLGQSGTQTIPNPDILYKVADLLGWLQLERHAIIVALVLFINLPARIDQSDGGVWTEFLASLKFADVYVSDKLWERKGWKNVFEWCVPDGIFCDFVFFERSLLSHPEFYLFRNDALEWGTVRSLIGVTMDHFPLSSVMLGTISFEKRFSPIPSPDERPKLKSGWELYKDEICRLYQTHKLEDVVKIMAEKYEFRASVRGYRNRLAQWRAKKRDMEDSSRKIEEGSQARDQLMPPQITRGTSQTIGLSHSDRGLHHDQDSEFL